MQKKQSLRLPEYLNQVELADVLGLSTRRVRGLEEIGLPVDESTGKKRYPKRACQSWYLKYKLNPPSMGSR